MKLDEQAKRRDAFRGGVPVRLWDDQEWSLPRPRVLWRPAAEGPSRSVLSLTLGPEFDRAGRAIDAAETPSELAEGMLGLATAMLLVNYDLTRADLHDLLAFDPDDDDNQARWAGIMRVVRGHGPDEARAAV